MKKITSIIAAASVAVIAVSCAKEITPEVSVESSPKLTRCILNVAIDPEMKLTFDGGKTSWVAGDEIAVYQYGRYKASATKKGEFTRDKTQNIFTARTTGENFFDGSIAGYLPIDTSGDGNAYNGETAQANNFYMWYPKSAIKSYSMSNSVTGLIVPLEQTGLLADLGKYAIFNSGISENGNIEYDSERDILKITASTTMKCITPIVKFTVPESLNACRIDISGMKDSAPAALAGDFSVRGSGSSSSFVAPTETSITINNGGANISGDVYVVLAPTSIGSGRVDTNDATSLVFTVFNKDGGRASVTGSIKTGNPFVSSAISYVGSLPATLDYKYVINTDLKLLEGQEPIVTLCDTLAGSTFFYTFGMGSCAEPTTSSTQFKACEGFSIPASPDDFSGTVFKILIHNEAHGDKTVSGLLRYWVFTSTNSMGAAFLDNPVEAGGSRTVNEMTVSNKKTDSAINFEKITTAYLGCNSSLYMTVPIRNTSNVSVFMTIQSNSSSSVRPYKVYKNDAATSMSSSTVPYASGSVTNVKTYIVHNIDGMKAGDPLTLWCNGGTYIYNYAVLETAETISSFPEAPDKICISVDFSKIGLPTSSSAALVGEYEFTTSGYPFSLYTYTGKMSEEPFTKYYYDKSNSRLLITRSAEGTQTDAAVYIGIPAINGYKLSKVTFTTSSKNKVAWVLAARDKNATKLGVFTVPQEGSADPVDVTVSDPGNLENYYFRFNNTSSVYISSFSVTYEKVNN